MVRVFISKSFPFRRKFYWYQQSMLDQSNHQVFKLLFMEYHAPCYIVRWCEVKGGTGRFEMLALLFWQTDNPDAMAEGCGVIIHWITLFPSCLISLRTVLD